MLTTAGARLFDVGGVLAEGDIRLMDGGENGSGLGGSTILVSTSSSLSLSSSMTFCGNEGEGVPVLCGTFNLTFLARGFVEE